MSQAPGCECDLLWCWCSVTQGRSTEGLSSSLEQLTLEGHSCQVGLPEGDTPTKEGRSLSGEEGRSPHCEDEESSSEDSAESKPCLQREILKDAGVEIVLEELSCSEDGKAPLELVTQVPSLLPSPYFLVKVGMEVRDWVQGYLVPRLVFFSYSGYLLMLSSASGVGWGD